MEFKESMETIAQAFEIVGVAIIIIGCAIALVRGLRTFDGLDDYFVGVKHSFGRPLILGLEILVAADIIKTITVDLSLTSVGTLALLVAVRIALSFSLDVELDGVVPWRRAELAASARPAAGVDQAD